mmetsp:Transcript_91877/g.263138  ORF Transcript_91877/g.263138 Transcript_91877/m.263138 type:complete len:236 (+) Transcript_91877:201-908(+)
MSLATPIRRPFCYLTNDQSEFLEECRLQDPVKLHNDFIFVSLQRGREHRHPSVLASLCDPARRTSRRCTRTIPSTCAASCSSWISTARNSCRLPWRDRTLRTKPSSSSRSWAQRTRMLSTRKAGLVDPSDGRGWSRSTLPGAWRNWRRALVTRRGRRYLLVSLARRCSFAYAYRPVVPGELSSLFYSWILRHLFESLSLQCYRSGRLLGLLPPPCGFPRTRLLSSSCPGAGNGTR